MKPSRIVVAAAQMQFCPEVEGNVAWIRRAIESVANQGVDVVLFPECAVTGYNCDFHALLSAEVEAGLDEIRKVVRAAGCNVLVGCPTLEDHRWFNSLIVLNRKGREVFRYSKIHLTPVDRCHFTPGNKLAYFQLDGIPCTAMICHERRYPELVRLPVMLGAQIVFHPNAGLDKIEISRRKRHGKDGIAVRAFENEVFYVFANSVGPQGDGLWSAGDSKIVSPDSRVLALANNRDEMLIRASLDLSLAGRKYAREALTQPAFLRQQWKELLAACRQQLRVGRHC